MMNLLASIGNGARWLVRRSLRLYYSRIEVEGRERLPVNGAVLFVANHPNSLMDPAADRELLTGTVERVTFHNDESGFAVLRVQVRGRNAPAGGAAGLHGLELPPALGPAADLLDDAAQGDAHGHLDQAAAADLAGQREGGNAGPHVAGPAFPTCGRVHLRA